MQLDVKENLLFVASVTKNKNILNYWRQRLTAFENRPKWELLPHPAQILVARSKGGEDCLEWMKTHEPAQWRFAEKNRPPGGASPAQLSKELNETIEAWLTEEARLTDFVVPGKPQKYGIRFSDSLGILMVVKFSKKEAEAISECEELLTGIRQGLNPFSRKRAKYDRPVTQAMIKKLLPEWKSQSPPSPYTYVY